MVAAVSPSPIGVADAPAPTPCSIFIAPASKISSNASSVPNSATAAKASSGTAVAAALVRKAPTAYLPLPFKLFLILLRSSDISPSASFLNRLSFMPVVTAISWSVSGASKNPFIA